MSARDHPRIHGEHQMRVEKLALRVGSPPHTRGTLNDYKCTNGKHGITPAYTGNTLRLDVPSSFPRDHPRIHGEHNWSACRFDVPAGSPPHTRGTLPRPISSLRAFRITPAYTGNTHKSRNRLVEFEDHPRIHGEHCVACVLPVG